MHSRDNIQEDGLQTSVYDPSCRRTIPE